MMNDGILIQLNIRFDESDYEFIKRLEKDLKDIKRFKNARAGVV